MIREIIFNDHEIDIEDSLDLVFGQYRWDIERFGKISLACCPRTSDICIKDYIESICLKIKLENGLWSKDYDNIPIIEKYSGIASNQETEFKFANLVEKGYDEYMDEEFKSLSDRFTADEIEQFKSKIFRQSLTIICPHCSNSLPNLSAFMRHLKTTHVLSQKVAAEAGIFACISYIRYCKKQKDKELLSCVYGEFKDQLNWSEFYSAGQRKYSSWNRLEGYDVNASKKE